MNTVVSITEFDGGMDTDDRGTQQNISTVLKHFDPLARKHRLSPYNSSVSADSQASAHQITNFLYYSGGVASGLFGLGQASAISNIVTLYVKGTTSGDLIANSAWNTFANSSGTAAAPSALMFTQYKGYAYGGVVASGAIWKCALVGGSFTDADITLSGSPTANGVVHSKDDCLYVASANNIYRKNDATWDNSGSPVLVLPTRCVVVSMCEFNDYLAIGCTVIGGNNVVYFWDRNSSLTTISASIDWGTGTLKTIKQVDEELVGISTIGTLYPMMIFRSYISGAGATIFKDLEAASAVGLDVRSISRKVNNRLQFAGGINIEGILYQGIWGVAKPEGSNQYSVWLDRLPNNNTALSNNSLLDFIYINDYCFITYQDGAYGMTFTDGSYTGAAGFTATSIYETLINHNTPLKDRTKHKSLKAVALSTVPLLTGQQAVLKYKVDGGAWTTISTATAVGNVTTESFKDASGTSFTSGREYKFRVESTGGAEITEVKYSYEVMESLL
jgi:hypothetical protein